MGLEQKLGDMGIVTVSLEKAVGWARSNAIWPMLFGLACCAIEMMSTQGARYDMSRFGMELIDCSDWAKTVEFRIFRGAVDEGKSIRAINVPNAAELFTRKKIDELTLFVQEDFGLKGLAWLKCTPEGKLEGSIAKNFTEPQLASLAQLTGAAPGSVLLFAADEYERAGKALYGLRRRLDRIARRGFEGLRGGEEDKHGKANGRRI